MTKLLFTLYTTHVIQIMAIRSNNGYWALFNMDAGEYISMNNIIIYNIII